VPRPTVGIIKKFKPEVEASDTKKCFLCHRNTTLREYVQMDDTIGAHACMLTKVLVVPSSVSQFSTRVKFTPVLAIDDRVFKADDASAVKDAHGNLSYPDPFERNGYLTRWQLAAGNTVVSYNRAIYEEDIMYILMCSRCYRWLCEWLAKLQEPDKVSARDLVRRLAENRRLIELGHIPQEDRRSYLERRNIDKPDRRTVNVFKDRLPHEQPINEE